MKTISEFIKQKRKEAGLTQEEFAQRSGLGLLLASCKDPMESFCQLDGRLTSDKYIGSYERCGKIISKYSSRPGIDLSEFFLRVRFSYAVGNSDMHLKKFSLIEYQKVNIK